MNRALALILTLAPAQAGAFDLASPIDCDLTQTCFIQQFMDHDPGPDARDFNCGSLSYNDHSGTDFALPDDAMMQVGVPVLAAAAGVVKGTRDGRPDIRVTDPAAPPLDGKDCGNGVVIDHGDGWETQYCHMRQGSIAVTQGQSVETGAQIGLVGLSGNTEFPHVHLSLRRNGAEVDPFAPDPAASCGSGTPGLWTAAIPTPPGGLVNAGISDAVPSFDAIKAGLPAPSLDTSSPALVLWAQYFGSRADDVLSLTLTGPDGQVVQDDVLLDRTQARGFRAIGRKARSPWPSGTYTGLAILTRQGAEIDRQAITLTLP